MNRFACIGMGIVMSALVATGLTGGGVAWASGPDLSGQTYGKASAAIESWGATAVIATVVGSSLATDDCIVSRSIRTRYLDSGGKKQGNVIQLDLNCNATVAGPGKSGNSAASPMGRTFKKELKILAWFNKDPKGCAAHAAYCEQLCNKYPDVCTIQQ